MDHEYVAEKSTSKLTGREMYRPSCTCGWRFKWVLSREGDGKIPHEKHRKEHGDQRKG